MDRPTAAQGRGWELRGHLPEPVERAGRAPPGLAAIPRVLGRLVLAAQGDEVGSDLRKFFPAAQKGGDMRVRADGLGEEGPGLVGGAGGTERQERLGVGPVGASILIVRLQELLEGLVWARQFVREDGAPPGG